MDFSNCINHPYHAHYNWLIERYANGDDSAEQAIRNLCQDIKGYDLLHAECVGIVEDYDNEQR